MSLSHYMDSSNTTHYKVDGVSCHWMLQREYAYLLVDYCQSLNLLVIQSCFLRSPHRYCYSALLSYRTLAVSLVLLLAPSHATQSEPKSRFGNVGNTGILLYSYITSIMDPGKPPSPPPPMPDPDYVVDDAKFQQEQLWLMFLAGCRTATLNQHYHSLQDDVDRGTTAPQPSAPMETPVDIFLHAAEEMESNSSTPTLMPVPLMTDPNRRIPTTSWSSPRTAASASSASSSATCSPESTGDANAFPHKLMELLHKEDPAVIAWLPRGDAFVCRDPDRFVVEVLPRYFRHTKVCFESSWDIFGLFVIVKFENNSVTIVNLATFVCS